MKVAVTFILVSIIVWSCHDTARIGDSVKYQNEELDVYIQLLDNILDSIGFEVLDTVKQVFYISDTLYNVDNEYIGVELNNRTYSIAELAIGSRRKFIRTRDSLKLYKQEHFTGQWLTISRVSLDHNMSNGSLRLTTWCGNLCAAGYWFEIEKKEGKWRIKKCSMIWVS